ncbi:YdcF family protein [Desulfovibrio sp. UCD-KL4C]|uniref:YdcF family protein n=1 Tax=Desulfovibrio sp. UCD-KL4C TaxID=2578120 RepID=UPI0025C522D8|nr:YdcF family protein [Desulfovibrio sp. UCD-KL4C]
MKLIRNLFTLLGAITFLGIVISAILFFYAPEILHRVDKLKKADAIVVLGGQYFRPIYAAELYNKGYGPLVLVSKPVVYEEIKATRSLGVNLKFQWEIYREILIKKGVPEKSIKYFGDKNMSTVDEAEQLKKEFTENKLPTGIKKIIIVTSPLHTGRAGRIFRDALPDKDFIVVGDPYEPILKKWWTNFRTAPYIVLESTKNIFYYLGGAFKSSSQN